MLDEGVVPRVAHGLQDGLERPLHGLDSGDLRSVEHHGSDASLVEIMVVEEEMEHLVYARHEAAIALLAPDRARVVGCQFAEGMQQLPSYVRQGEASGAGRTGCVHHQSVSRAGAAGNVRDRFRAGLKVGAAAASASSSPLR